MKVRIIGGRTIVPECPADTEFLKRILDDPETKADSRIISFYIRLFCDWRMNRVWAALKSAAAARALSMPEMEWSWLCMYMQQALLRAVNRSKFDLMTDAERARWLADTRATVAKLRTLLQEVDGALGNPGEHFPLEVHEQPLVHFMTLIGVKYDPDAASKGHYVSDAGCGCSLSPEERRREGIPVDKWEFDRARKALSFSIDDVLDSFSEQLSAGVDSAGPIKKPRDRKAKRAAFISNITELLTQQLQLKLTDAIVAELCCVITEDESITPSLVSRFKYRGHHAKVLV